MMGAYSWHPKHLAVCNGSANQITAFALLYYKITKCVLDSGRVGAVIK